MCIRERSVPHRLCCHRRRPCCRLCGAGNLFAQAGGNPQSGCRSGLSRPRHRTWPRQSLRAAGSQPQCAGSHGNHLQRRFLQSLRLRLHTARRKEGPLHPDSGRILGHNPATATGWHDRRAGMPELRKPPQASRVRKCPGAAARMPPPTDVQQKTHPRTPVRGSPSRRDLKRQGQGSGWKARATKDERYPQRIRVHSRFENHAASGYSRAWPKISSSS